MQQYGAANNNNLPIIVPKSNSSDDTTITHNTNYNYSTPSITPHSSNLGQGVANGAYHQEDML